MSWHRLYEETEALEVDDQGLSCSVLVLQSVYVPSEDFKRVGIVRYRVFWVGGDKYLDVFDDEHGTEVVFEDDQRELVRYAQTGFEIFKSDVQRLQLNHKTQEWCEVWE